MESTYLRKGLRPDATGKFGASSLQKVVSAIRYMAYGIPADGLDEYCGLGASAVFDSLYASCDGVVRKFGGKCLRPPNANEMENIERRFRYLSFPWCAGVLDCVRWDWSNNSRALQGAMCGKEESPTPRMEVIADSDLYI